MEEVLQCGHPSPRVPHSMAGLGQSGEGAGGSRAEVEQAMEGGVASLWVNLGEKKQLKRHLEQSGPPLRKPQEQPL